MGIARIDALTSPKDIFAAMRRDKKPYLNGDGASIRAMLRNMARRDMITTAPNLSYIDFDRKAPQTPEQRTRLESDAHIQPYTHAMMQSHQELFKAMGDAANNLTFLGANAFDRNRGKLGPWVGKIQGPIGIGDGNFFEAELISRAVVARKKDPKLPPVIIYNPKGFWDPLLRDHPVTRLDRDYANIRIARTPEEFGREAWRLPKRKNKQANLNDSYAPGFFTVQAADDVSMVSHNESKRFTTFSVADESGAAINMRFFGDIVHFRNAPEIAATGSGNAFAKKVQAIATYKQHETYLQKRGFDSRKIKGLTSDISIESLHPDIRKHPFLKRYSHILKPGQRFAGTEWALADKTTNMETLIYDLHRALNDLEAKGKTVDRRVKITCVMYMFPADQKLAHKPNKTNVKFMASAGSQTYILRRDPTPLERMGYEIDHYLSFVEQPHVSVEQINRKEKRIHANTHTARAWHAMMHAVKMPRMEAPAILRKPKLTTVLTNRHFDGTWTRASDHFTKASIHGFEGRGYRFASAWEGGRDFTAIEHFRNSAQALVFLPYDFSNPDDKIVKTQANVNELLLQVSDLVDNELSNPYVRGRPRVIMETHENRVHSEMREHIFRIGLGAKNPRHSAQFITEGQSLADALDAGWNKFEYVAHPDLPEWESSPIIPESPKNFNVFMIGNAKTYNAQALKDSFDFVVKLHEHGMGEYDGYGGEGHMLSFAKAGAFVSQFRDDVWRWGVTAQEADLEGSPKCLENTYLKNNYTFARNIYVRVDKLYPKKVGAAVAWDGGPGSFQELLRGIDLNLKGADRDLIVNNSGLPYLGGQLGPYDPLLARFSEATKKRLGIYVVNSGGEAFERLQDTQARNRRHPRVRVA